VRVFSHEIPTLHHFIAEAPLNHVGLLHRHLFLPVFESFSHFLDDGGLKTLQRLHSDWLFAFRLDHRDFETLRLPDHERRVRDQAPGL